MPAESFVAGLGDEAITLWDRLQVNGAFAYDHDPLSSLSVGERADVASFAAFADLQGLILDIGCGPQVLPAYARGHEASFVGIDPLRGSQPRDFHFAVAIGEFLPFEDEQFDRVLFATSLDHCIDPIRTLREAVRVLKADGQVVVWTWDPDDARGGVTEPVSSLASRARATISRVRNALSPSEVTAGPVLGPTFAEAGTDSQRLAEVSTTRGSMILEVPEGAIDPFHAHHPTGSAVLEWMNAAGLIANQLERPLPHHLLIRGLPR
jgi:SAM-dependent methyltransferase